MKKAIILSCLIFLFSFFSFSQNVGIGTTSPGEKLDVAGNIKGDTIKPTVLKITTNAAAGKILTSDAAGNGNWQSNNSAAGSNAGFGPWGDCSTNAIGEYNPVVDTSGAVNDAFGVSVSISGNYAIAGALADDVGGNSDQGSASIFQFDGNNWVFMQKLTDATGSTGDAFGRSVSVSGSYAVIGSYLDDVGANTDQGSVSIYQLTGGSWVLMNKITDPGGAANDNFGVSVSISANYIVIGSNYADGIAGADQGSASVFQLSGGNWIFMQKISDATGVAGESFGRSVSLSGNYIIASAYGDVGPAGAGQGSASIFQLSGGTWVLMNKIYDNAGSVNDFFGTSVSISGKYAVVGVPYDDVGANTDQGSVLAFQFDGSNWVLMQKIVDPTGAAFEQLGFSVSISGIYMMAGSAFDDVGANADQGSVTIYQRFGLGFGKLQFVTDPGGNAGDGFGYSTAMDYTSKRFLTGAPFYANISGKAVFGKIN